MNPLGTQGVERLRGDRLREKVNLKRQNEGFKTAD